MRLSVVIPTLNEESVLGDTLATLERLDGDIELIVADGGSCDKTCEIAVAWGARLVTGASGRGAQMAAGAKQASGDVLWFLHADTIVPLNANALILDALAVDSFVAGNFKVRFSGTSRSARFMSWLHPKIHGSRLAFGDSAIFIRRNVYEKIGEFSAIPLFEDLDLVKRTLKAGRFVRVEGTVTTSSRRFSNRSLLSMYSQWGILLALYKLGASPAWLARCYNAVR